MSKKPTVVSLYAGCGGIDAGFTKAGFNVVFATDIWETACQSIQANSPHTQIVCNDIQNVDFTEILSSYGPIDCLTGGPPCPPFSKSRFYRTEKKRGIDDENGFITLNEYFRALAILKPRVFLFENVHGFVYKPHSDALEYLQQQSALLDYQLSFKVVNAADYGVPQTRERFICVGTAKDMPQFNFPEPTHAEKAVLNRQPWVTCGDVLNDIDFDLPEDSKMQAGSKHKDLLKLVPPGDNYLYFTKERGYPDPIFEWRSRYWSFLLKLSPDRPSWTIQASQSNNMGPFHWKNRFLRIQEIKRIQTFSDDYVLAGTFKDQWRQIGNAVPPELAHAFAEAIKNQYFLSTNSWHLKQIEMAV